MQLTGPLLVVKDIEKSLAFYETVLGCKTKMDLGGNITLDSGLILQDHVYWCKFLGIEEQDIDYKNHAFELYFEEDDFDKFIRHLKSLAGIEYANEITEFPWGQKSVRIYDPDGHIIEIGQSMRSVIRSFAADGMTAAEVSERTQHPIDYVNACLANN